MRNRFRKRCWEIYIFLNGNSNNISMERYYELLYELYIYL